jgi:RNA polymerase sigma factor (sigma-70 family)
MAGIAARIERDSESVEDQTAVSSAHEVVAVEPVIRRVVAARAANPADIDDLVQDCLERLLAARERLAPEALVPYAVVTARNLVSSHAKRVSRHAAATPRILEVAEPERPEDLLLAGESRSAMTAALSQLSAQERGSLLAYYDDFPGAGELGPESRGALRVRMSRTRAKLRLEYLLAFRHLELPTPRCRGVLLAISAGDQRRQRELDAGQHLLDCETCATLSEPLDRRSVALTAIAVPGALVAWAAAKARAHPLHAAGSAAAGAAVVAGSVVLLTSGHPAPAAPSSHPAPTHSAPTAGTRRTGPPSAPQVISELSVGGRPVSDAAAGGSLRSLIGEPADASGASVVAAVTRNGFWIGTARGQLWVELVGPLRPLHIRAGDRVRFAGTVAGNPAAYPASAGVTVGNGARLLSRQGVHLAVNTTEISVGP